MNPSCPKFFILSVTLVKCWTWFEFPALSKTVLQLEKIEKSSYDGGKGICMVFWGQGFIQSGHRVRPGQCWRPGSGSKDLPGVDNALRLTRGSDWDRWQSWVWAQKESHGDSLIKSVLKLGQPHVKKGKQMSKNRPKKIIQSELQLERKLPEHTKLDLSTKPGRTRYARGRLGRESRRDSMVQIQMHKTIARCGWGGPLSCW